MRLKWSGYCNICSSPLDIRIISTGGYELDLAHTYKIMKPRDWDMNEPWYKFFGIKCRRVCVACSLNINAVRKNHHKLRERETGTNFFPKYRSVTMDELNEWWNEFKSFCQRPDVSQYIIPYDPFFYLDDDSENEDFNEFVIDIWGRPENYTHYLADYT